MKFKKIFKKRARGVLLVLSGTILLAGCNFDYFADASLEEFTWDPTLAIPLGEITYTVQELFQDLNGEGLNIGENANDVVTITYEEELQSQTATEFLTLADQEFGARVESGVSINLPGISGPSFHSEVIEFAMAATQNEEYDSVDFSNGDILVQLESEFEEDIDYVLTIRSLISEESDTKLVLRGTLTSENPTRNFSDELDKYFGDFSKNAAGGVARNTMVVAIDYVVNVEPLSVIGPQEAVSFNVNIKDAEFDMVYGFVGERNLDVNFDVVNLNFFDSFDEGTISFINPHFNFVFNNSFGFPLGVSFKEIAAITRQGQIIKLSGPAANANAIVDGPEITDIGTNVTTEYELNNSNSNVAELIGSMPTKVIIEVNSISNPSEASDQYNFVASSSELVIGVKMDLPLNVNIQGLVSSENVPFDVASNLEQAKKLVLRLVAENTLPLGGEIELVFLDAKGDEVFRAQERPVFDAAPVGSDGRTTEITKKIVDVTFQEADIRELEKATEIKVITRLTSTDADADRNVRFFNDYDLKISLAVQADVEIGATN